VTPLVLIYLSKHHHLKRRLKLFMIMMENALNICMRLYVFLYMNLFICIYSYTKILEQAAITVHDHYGLGVYITYIYIDVYIYICICIFIHKNIYSYLNRRLKSFMIMMVNASNMNFIGPGRTFFLMKRINFIMRKTEI
jgi:hypothetical protein